MRQFIHNYARCIMSMKSRIHATEVALPSQVPYSYPQMWRHLKTKLERLIDSSPLLLRQIQGIRPTGLEFPDGLLPVLWNQVVVHSYNCSHTVPFQTWLDFYKPLVAVWCTHSLSVLGCKLPGLLCLLCSASLFSWKVEAKQHCKATRGLD